MIEKLSICRSAAVRMCTGLSLSLLSVVLFLFLTTSCTDESSPVDPDGGAGNCMHYENYYPMSCAAFCETPGTALGVAVSGDYAYVADYGAGFQVVDISEPESPAIVGSVNTPGYARDVAVSGDYAYVTDFDYNLLVIDISVPSTPTIIASVEEPKVAWSVIASGNYIYVADYDAGLIIFPHQCE